MGLSFPLGFTVVLTERGKNYLGGITNGVLNSDYQVPQTEKEYKDIMKRVQKKVKTAFEQQKAIERAVGKQQLQQALNAYSLTSPITLKKKNSKDILKTLSQSEEERKQQYKEFESLIDSRKKVVHQIMAKVAEWQRLGKTTASPEALVAAFKKLKLDFDKLEENLNEIESNLEHFALEEVESSEYFQSEFQKLLATYQNSNDYNVSIETDSSAGSIKVKITSNTNQTAAEALEKYFQKQIDGRRKHSKDMREFIQKLRNMKNTTYEGNQRHRGGVRYLLNEARAGIAGIKYSLDMSEEEKKTAEQKYAATRANAQISRLSDEIVKAIEEGKQNFSFVMPVSGYTEKSWGNLSEGIHDITFEGNVDKEVEQAILKIMHTGQTQYRTQFKLKDKVEPINLSRRIKTIEKLDTAYAADPSFDEQEKSYKNYIAQEAQTTSKIDNLLSLTSNKGEFYIAFSDKFYSGFNLSHITMIGESNFSSEQPKTTSLLNNIDLFMSKGNKELTSQLIFILLNMASASVYSADFAAQKEKITYLVKQMVSSYLLEIAFDVESFIDNLLETDSLGIHSINQDNTFLVFNLADGLFVKSTDLLQGLLEQLKRLGDEGFQELVTVSVAADTVHRAVPLYQASLKQEPPSADEMMGEFSDSKIRRWEWVATQIAQNTELNVKLSIHSLLQFFDINKFEK